MNDWNLWLNSSETRVAIKLLRKKANELSESIASGYILQHDQVDKIAVDFAHKVGSLEGIKEALRMIKEIKDEVDDE